MIVLGLDTATPSTVVGLMLSDGNTLQARDDPTGGQRPGHATRLLPLVEALLVESGLAWKQIERIAVGVGPGTFTGLRIGIATARGLSQSLDIPLVGVSSLRALAHAVDVAGHRVSAEDIRAPDSGSPHEPATRDSVAAPHLSASPRETGVLAVIDARRDEVFLAAYDASGELLAPRALPPTRSLTCSNVPRSKQSPSTGSRWETEPPATARSSSR